MDKIQQLLRGQASLKIKYFFYLPIFSAKLTFARLQLRSATFVYASWSGCCGRRYTSHAVSFAHSPTSTAPPSGRQSPTPLTVLGSSGSNAKAWRSEEIRIGLV